MTVRAPVAVGWSLTRQLDLAVALAFEQAVGVVGGGQFLAVDRQQEVADRHRRRRAAVSGER